MGALPKQRVSRHRQGNRRRHHFISAVHLVECRNCHELKLPHHVCPNCGWYNGRQVLQIEERRRPQE